MRNYDTDPSKGAEAGEAVWMFSTGILASYHRYHERHPHETRGESMDRVHRELETERLRKLAVTSQARKALADIPKEKSKKQPKGKGKAAAGKGKAAVGKGNTGVGNSVEVEGTVGSTPLATGLDVSPKERKSWNRIIAEPVLLEMLLGTKSCLYPYDKILGARQVDVMLEPNSGAFAALYWLSVQTLIRVRSSESPGCRG
jgi:hypothetical protein